MSSGARGKVRCAAALACTLWLGASSAAQAQASYELDLGLWGEAYLEGEHLGVAGDARGELAYTAGAHRVSLTPRYTYDPHALKTFAFAEDEADEADGGDNTASRLVQSSHQGRVALAWEAAWLDSFASTVFVRGDLEQTALRPDWSRTFDTGAGLHWGGRGFDPGPRIEAEGGYFLRGFPNYRVADRSLDQHGGEARLAAVYSFGRIAEVEAAYETRLTTYRDARYDRLDEDGAIVRADESKRYWRHDAGLALVLRPVTRLRLALGYTYRHHDSRDYDRALTGLAADGTAERRFVRDTYDYDRHEVGLAAAWRSRGGFRVSGSLAYWVRPFATYQARDADNVWLDETRTDRQVEADLTLSLPLVQTNTLTLAASAEASYLRRASNMRRERSFATNYTISQLSLGLELTFE
jgi:hypothetical protein